LNIPIAGDDPMDYTRLSLGDVVTALDDVAREARETFGGLDAKQLNWRPDARAWGVAQCFEHLLTANRLMVTAAQHALAHPPTFWQRVPLVPGFLGRQLVRSQAPQTTRKFTTSAAATPSQGAIGPDVITRFAAAHQARATWIQSLDPDTAARAIMTSPFVKIITYSVLDGCRLMAAHDRRHFEQARRVMQAAGFPLRGQSQVIVRR
jgi:hypothetical protein